MKTCVFITGTHAVGKSSLAWAIIDRYGGVDRITNDKGSSCTARLADVVEEALKHSDICFCEGSFMNTFGLNLSNALFKAQRFLVVSLYADGMTIYKRLQERSNGKNGKRDFNLILKKQRQAMIAARKWHDIGVPVLQVNTASASTEELLEMTINKISETCGLDMTIR